MLRGEKSLLRGSPAAPGKPAVPGVRLPAGSRLQKVHNAKLATKELCLRGILPAGTDYKAQVRIIGWGESPHTAPSHIVCVGGRRS